MEMTSALAELVDDFQSLGDTDRTILLLELADELPELPAHLEAAAMEPVPECQSPIFLQVDASDPAAVRLYFSAPREAPTTRGFAAILHQGLDGASAEQIAAVPLDFVDDLRLDSVVSPLRLRGMTGMLTRIKRQVAQQTA
ncbi:SufE family protein [Gordonia hirsuta DSM 44140 = NBRC 16056]|uniref:SufE family protein n=1 Tax=Gordonia hirsuta DSM 44140 = NBRC 16056 TaxID=1121927 RepID=L7L9K7_9ACTN|nr:SufE family protein [Gordonia hirsuta]GAC56732.1 SufE family protein [Gordonia hirsuta DSM 44140 = NBRC 16056]